MPQHLINATCRSARPTATRSPPPPAPRTKGGAARMGEGIFLLFLTPTAPDYHILRSEPKKHHSAMLQLGRLPSPARGRTGGTQRGAGACSHGWERARACKSVQERVSVCTHGPQGTTSYSPSRCDTAVRILPDGAERLPAACKRVCFSSSAPHSIRNNYIWECGEVFGWLVLV